MIKFEKAKTADAKGLALASWKALDNDIHYGAPEKGGPPGYKSEKWQSRIIRMGKYYKILDDHRIIGGIIVLITISSKLNVLTLGQSEAKALGVNTMRIKLIAFAFSAFITAVAVGLTGLIGFVGLIVPHGVRLVIGPDHRQLLPFSAFAGAAFLVIADTIARSVFSGSELPVGVITAMVGGPFFLILMVRYSRKVSWIK